MKTFLFAITLAVALAHQTDKLQSEVLISTLTTAELTKRLATATGIIEHKGEVARGGPVAAVVRMTDCMKDTSGACKATADVVIYKPDGSVFQEAKNLGLTAGRGVVPVKIAADSATGVYKIRVTVRDLTARRFGTVERQFGVK
jgi:hypothetical protein